MLHVPPFFSTEYPAFQPDIDPDVLQTLEALENDDFVVDFTDDFIHGLNNNGESLEERDENCSDYDSDQSSSCSTDASSFDSSDESFDQKSTGQSVFSMSSSNMHRNSGLSTLDDQFDKVLLFKTFNTMNRPVQMMLEYATEEIGELESSDEAVKGGKDLDAFNDVFDEFLEKYEIVGRKMVPRMEKDAIFQDVESPPPNPPTNNISSTEIESQGTCESQEPMKNTAKNVLLTSSTFSRILPERWDCESVQSDFTISTFSHSFPIQPPHPTPTIVPKSSTNPHNASQFPTKPAFHSAHFNPESQHWSKNKSKMKMMRKTQSPTSTFHGPKMRLPMIAKCGNKW